LIWHVDENNYHNDYEWYPGHTDYGHYMVALEQADNQYSLEKKVSYGDGGDPYPGNTVNTPSARPVRPDREGTAFKQPVAITNISPSGPQMTADFAVSLVSGNDGDDDPPHTADSSGTELSQSFQPDNLLQVHAAGGRPYYYHDIRYSWSTGKSDNFRLSSGGPHLPPHGTERTSADTPLPPASTCMS